jgi:hypothetical protein
MRLVQLAEQAVETLVLVLAMQTPAIAHAAR